MHLSIWRKTNMTCCVYIFLNQYNLRRRNSWDIQGIAWLYTRYTLRVLHGYRYHTCMYVIVTFKKFRSLNFTLITLCVHVFWSDHAIWIMVMPYHDSPVYGMMVNCMPVWPVDSPGCTSQVRAVKHAVQYPLAFCKDCVDCMLTLHAFRYLRRQKVF